MRRSYRLSERGASLVLTAFTLFVLLGASAIAVDLAALRADRSSDQKVSDSGASAGAIAVADGGAGAEACESALAYIAINTQEISSLDTSICSDATDGFQNASCIANDPESVTVISGRFTITITYPVVDDADLMDGVFGATQTVTSNDGAPCERVGVEISADRQAFFSQLLGWDQGTTNVHTVAIADLIDVDGVPLNLLVLERTGCKTINVQGQGGIVVNAVINEAGTGLIQGVAASDSDGSSGTCGSDGVIHVQGDSSVLRADGPEGCAEQTGTTTVGAFTSGLGCGSIQVFAPGTPGCSSSGNLPACVAPPGNLISPNPDPIALPGRLTRAPIDSRFNCWPDYTAPPVSTSWAVDPLTSVNGQDIPGCPSTSAFIYTLIEQVGRTGTPTGFTTWTSLGYPCDVPSSHPAISISGDIHVDCPRFIVRTTITLSNGNFVFDGHVEVTSGTGHLILNNTLADPGWAFMRGGSTTYTDSLGSTGTLLKSGDASLTINYTAVYLSKTSRVAMAGGLGTLTWIAPDSGRFDDLALWSDSPIKHDWAGQANLAMEGVFFMPWALAEYAGTGGQNQTEAQWVASRLVARGQGQLVVAPSFGRAIEFGGILRSTIVR